MVLKLSQEVSSYSVKHCKKKYDFFSLFLSLKSQFFVLHEEPLALVEATLFLHWDKDNMSNCSQWIYWILRVGIRDWSQYFIVVHGVFIIVKARNHVLSAVINLKRMMFTSSITACPWRDVVGWILSQLTLGKRRGYTLDKPPVHCRQTTTHAHIHTYG